MLFVLQVGVCGEHAGDASSIRFFYHEGVETLSCSPYKIPLAKVAAAQARIEYLTRKSLLFIFYQLLYVIYTNLVYGHLKPATTGLVYPLLLPHPMFL